MIKDEKKLIEGIRRGNRKVFEQLYEGFYMRLYLYALSYLEESSIAEDMVQDIFFKLWDHRKKNIIRTSVSSYLFRAVHNRCIQYLRQQKVSNRYVDETSYKLREAQLLYHAWDEKTHSLTEYNEISKIIERSYLILPPKTKEVFQLSREQSMSNREISEKLEISIKTVEYHISSALKIFKETLKDYFILIIAYVLF